MGGDGIYDPTFIQLAKGNANGDYATSLGASAEQLDSARSFVENYDKAGYKEPYAAYGAYAYDASWAIILAVKAASKDGRLPIRDEVTKAAQGVSFDGVTGRVAFDQYGDTTSKVLTMYRVEGDRWVAAKTGQLP